MFYKIFRGTCFIANKYKNICLIALCFSIMICCKKETLSDLEASISARLSNSSMVSYVQKGSMTTFNGVTYNYVTSYVGIPITLKSSPSTDDTIVANVDTAMVAAYNQLYQEKNPEIPSNAFKVSHNGRFPINNGNSQGADSLYVVLNDASKLKTNTTYLIPIQLQAKRGSELKYSLFFIKMTVSIGQLTARMDFGNRWGTATPYWRNSTQFIQYLPASNGGVMIGPDSVRFGVTLNTAFNPSDVKVDAIVAVDDSTMTAYSKVFGTIYRAWPADTYELRRSSVTVKAKSRIGADSLCLVIKNKAKFTRLTYYLLGLKIKRNGSNTLSVPAVTSDSCRAFVSFFVL